MWQTLGKVRSLKSRSLAQIVRLPSSSLSFSYMTCLVWIVIFSSKLITFFSLQCSQLHAVAFSTAIAKHNSKIGTARTVIIRESHCYRNIAKRERLRYYYSVILKHACNNYTLCEYWKILKHWKNDKNILFTIVAF